MNRLLCLLLVLLAGACTTNTPQPRHIADFNFDWRFCLGDSLVYSAPDFDDQAWRTLRLPHDWAIEGEFSGDNPSTPGGGALPGGVGWYRKTFRAEAQGKQTFVEFDGIFMNSTVWVNGHEVGHRPFGYASLCYDITRYLQPGDNQIAVRCDNSQQPNSRWYSGCGIYRNVRLVTTDPLHVAYSGTFVTTPHIDTQQAEIQIETTLRNDGTTPRQAQLHQRILDPQGHCVAECESPFAIDADTSTILHTSLTIRRPVRWDIDHPALYTLETLVEENHRPIDNYRTRFGIREFEFSPESGFSLNGRPLKIKGVCMHHDLGALGAAVHRRAIERQLEILRGMGCNAIRTSHNPPAPELLDLCDSMGFLVMDEALDIWQRHKTQYDYSLYFDRWHQRDVCDFIRRDRNHPSVIVWSVGNEILEQWNTNDNDPDSGTLTAEQANLLMNYRSQLPQQIDGDDNPNVVMTHHMVQLIRSLDTTRPITAGCNEPTPINNLLRSGALDIVGYNYHEAWYDSIPKWYPGKAALGSETVSSVQSRGCYFNPSTTERVQPLDWRVVYDTDHHQCSAYDHSRVPWGALHERSWIDIRDRNFMASTFIWTGFDYLGEPTPYTWPSRSSYFGIVDLAGFPKDVYYLYRSEWTDRPTLHLFPHWNWQEGDKIDLWVYYNCADEVELLVNGRSLGRQHKSSTQLHCLWSQVAFEPGEITAIAYRNGEETDRTTRYTAGTTAQIRLTPDRRIIRADGYDLSYITVDAVDAEGREVPTADDELRFEVTGAGELVGVDNGNAAAHYCLKGDRMPLFNGKAIAIIRSLRGQKGRTTLRVESPTTQSSLQIESR